MGVVLFLNNELKVDDGSGQIFWGPSFQFMTVSLHMTQNCEPVDQNEESI